MVISRGTLAHESSFKSTPPTTHAVTSLSTSSLLSTPIPTTSLQTLHVTTLESGEPSLTLHVRSRAPAGYNIPTFHGGDLVTGDVVLNLTPKEAQYVTLVEIELQGEVSASGRSSHRFLTERSTLWTCASAMNSSASPVSSQTEIVERARVEDIIRPRVIQITSSSLNQPLRSPNTSYCSFRSALHSMGGVDRRSEVEVPSHMVISTHFNKPRIRLEPSRPHVWPFELLFPTYISSSAAPAAQRPESPITLSSHLFHPDQVAGDGTESTQENEGKGGVRTEKVGDVRAKKVGGYGFDWHDGDESRYIRHDEGTMALEQTEHTLEWNISSETPRGIFVENETKLLPTVERTILTSADKEHTFKLPPSFSESASVARLEYKLVVTVHRRGLLRGEKSLCAELHVPHPSYLASEPSTGEPLCTIHPAVLASQLPGPRENPDGWNLTPEVVMQLQPKLRRSGGVVNNDTVKAIVLKLALSRPLCYARGTTIPFRVTISIPHPHMPASKDKLEKSTGRKCRVCSALASHATVPSLIPGVAPLFRKARAPPVMCGAHVESHATTRHSAKPPPVLPQPNLSLAPSTAAIAAAIRLVRATHVGPDANDNSNMRRRYVSFLHTISTAVIHDNASTEDDVAGGVEEAGREFKSWATEQGRLVRTFVGEIPLKDDIKSSFLFSHLVLQYAVVLCPFDVSGFTPSSNEPLWSEPVNITAHLAKSGPARA